MWFNTAGQGILKKRPPARFPDAYLISYNTKCTVSWEYVIIIVECLQCRTAAGKVWFVLEATLQTNKAERKIYCKSLIFFNYIQNYENSKKFQKVLEERV